MQITSSWKQAAAGIAIPVVCCALFFLAADILPGFQHRQNTEDVQEGRTYLEQQSKADLAPVRNLLRQIRIETLNQKALEDPDALFSAFNGSMILGDSRASGFYYYGFLPKSICLAEMNQTINNLTDYVSQVQNAQPEYIYISYGANDVKARLGTDETDGYGKLAEQKIDALLHVSPNSHIVVSSIIPVAQGVFTDAENSLLEDYNRQLQELCSRRGWIYADNDVLIQNNPDGFGPDGIHFDVPFYPKWAANLLNTALLETEGS